MQKVEEITSMFPQINHHTDSSIHHESTHDQSNKTITNSQELQQMPFSSEINSSESLKYKLAEEPDCKSQAAPNEALDQEEADHDTCTTEVATAVPTKSEGTAEDSSSSGRERLKRHRVEVAGRVWIPDMWGQEDFLKDWIDCAAFDASLVNSSIMSARASLVEEGTRANSTRLRVENSC